ncbi:hypothetical protein IW146_005070 [Coemansia sp. RSA 922]|nr:hypothetical protein H4S04_001229 [Coemansia sp. S16]KAJ2069045.1 hypothetical protein GGI08_000555 [Coemansia sp. S2]KAJ2111834.1 hypothetical protein IW146_005070 [Coemansia sp. RSA 922]KAJ2354030.1 hypothetical protein GGH92_000288 [Coemansia sp. RSA 2673]
MSTSGLLGTPATKVWLAGMSLASALAGALGWRRNLRLQLTPNVTHNWQVWRLASSLVGFPSWSEVLTALVLIYQLRAVERLLGTRRFASFLVVSGIVGQTLTIAGMLLARLNSVSSGPYVLLFACVHQFYVLVPHSYYAQVLGIAVADKWTVYATAACLLAPRLPMAAVPALAGVAASMVYSADVAGLKRWRLPQWIVNLAQRCVAPLLLSTSRAGRIRRSSTTPAVDVAPEQVDLIAGMFPDADREHIANVLRMVGNDSNRAVAVLLDS